MHIPKHTKLPTNARVLCVHQLFERSNRKSIALARGKQDFEETEPKLEVGTNINPTHQSEGATMGDLQLTS